MQESSSTMPLWFMPVLFVALWCFVGFLISLACGWFALSKRFRRQTEPYGEARSAGPFFFKVYWRYWAGYGSAIRLIAADDALYLSVLFLFRVGHPPLCIPWSEIKFGRTKFLWWRYVVLTLGNEEKIPMRISERMANQLGILDRVPD